MIYANHTWHELRNIKQITSRDQQCGLEPVSKETTVILDPGSAGVLRSVHIFSRQQLFLCTITNEIQFGISILL